MTAVPNLRQWLNRLISSLNIYIYLDTVFSINAKYGNYQNIGSQYYVMILGKYDKIPRIVYICD
jgi:hypothetical protein